jgi:peroxiredoxin
MTLALAGVATLAVFTCACWLIFQLLAQNGRMLERIDRLEQTVDALDPLKKSRLVRDGLKAGTLAPDFQLPRVGGTEVSLAQYKGRRVLLVFSDPACGPCNELAPKLQQRHAQRAGCDIIMVSRGDAGANLHKMAEHGITFPVALQRQWEISRLYGMFATPIAYLIDEDGIIAAPVAVGPDRILALLEQRGVIWHSFKPRPRQAQA